MKNKLINIVFVIYLILLSWLVLFKFATSFESIPHLRNINLIPFGDSVIVNGKIYLKEIIYNILIFIPLGVYLCIIKKDLSLLKKVLIGFFVSLFFETMQYIFYLGGSDITDLIGNTFGTLIGVGLYPLLKKIFKNKTIRVINIIGFTIEIVAFFLLIFLTLAN